MSYNLICQSILKYLVSHAQIHLVYLLAEKYLKILLIKHIKFY